MPTTAHIDEMDLLLRLNRGDAQAFHVLYERYKTALAAKLLKLLKSDDLVEDTLQDVFLKLWEYRSQIDAQRTFAPLLYQMARNKVTDLYRKAYRDMSLREQLSYDGTAVQEPVDHRIIDREEMAVLQKALERLPARQRELFTLHKIEGKSYKEISEMLSISHAAINQHIYRATQSLNQTLQPNVQVTLACLAGMAALYLS